MTEERIKIYLTSSEALVLFEFLSRFSSAGSLDIVDQAEERVLWDICSNLEGTLDQPLAEDYDALIAKARAAVRDKNS
jgi:hypothetical protein